MKVVILAGGYGSRLSEETDVIPKPMIEIGGKPILWHIMKMYSAYGFNEFIICCGYKGNVIKEFFSNYFLYLSDVTFSMLDNTMEVHQRKSEPWKVSLINTGQNTMTGGRLLRVKDYLNDETFCFTYGDGVSDINIAEVVKHHKSQKRFATISAVQPPGRFGLLSMGDNFQVNGFKEKPQGDNSWINGGFFVLETEIFNYLTDDSTVWEKDPLINLAKENQLTYFKHNGFWHPMDTLRDKNNLNFMWKEGNAPWKIW